MLDLQTKTVRDIALEMPLTTRVFEEFKIDYCCGGRRPFAEACAAAGADPETVGRRIDELAAGAGPDESEWLGTASLTALIDHIYETHHVFTRAETALLAPLMRKVADRHGPQHPELLTLETLFAALCDDLGPHLVKEETILFPYVRALEKTHEGDAPPATQCFETVRNPVRAMMNEHDTAGDLLRRMRAVTMEYKLPEDACPSFAALYTRLEALEKDLHRHIHLENNLLFPRAVELEEKLFK